MTADSTPPLISTITGIKQQDDDDGDGTCHDGEISGA